MSGLVERLRELRMFLNGTGSLDGLEFGDEKPVGRHRNGRFWWRDRLPVLDEAAARITALEAEVERYRPALEHLSRIYPGWSSARIAFVRERARAALSPTQTGGER